MGISLLVFVCLLSFYIRNKHTCEKGRRRVISPSNRMLLIESVYDIYLLYTLDDFVLYIARMRNIYKIAYVE